MKMRSLGMLILVLCSCSNKIENKKIDSIRIYSVNWNSSFLISQTPNMIVNNPRAIVVDSVPQYLINKIQIDIKKFIPVNVSVINFDCRISCLLFNNKVMDTLSFSKGRLMQYNSKFYEEDSLLLWLIAKELPDYQYQQLEIGRSIVNFDHYR